MTAWELWIRHSHLRWRNGYAYDLHVQIADAVLCHHFHTAPQRLSRWLLRAGDRVGSDTLDLTHELLAHVLGIPRSARTPAISGIDAATSSSGIRDR